MRRINQTLWFGLGVVVFGEGEDVLGGGRGVTVEGADESNRTGSDGGMGGPRREGREGREALLLEGD
jgi:hypothetical protein